MLADHAVRIAEPAPLGGNDGHLVAYTQLTGDDAHDIDIAAMRIDDNKLAQTGFRHLRAYRRPDGDQQFGAEGKRTWTIDMLVGLADFLGRQDEDIEVLGPLPAQFRQHAVG